MTVLQEGSLKEMRPKRQTNRKTTSQGDNIKGRQHQSKTTLQEKSSRDKQPNRKMTSKEDILTTTNEDNITIR